jgi:hypothetical protein
LKYAFDRMASLRVIFEKMPFFNFSRSCAIIHHGLDSQEMQEKELLEFLQCVLGEALQFLHVDVDLVTCFDESLHRGDLAVGVHVH